MRMTPLARTLLAIAAAHSCAHAQSGLTVAVFNYSGAPRSVLGTAIATARMAFLSVRIESRWVVCGPEKCAEPSGVPIELFVMPRLRAPLTDRVEFPAGYAMPDAFAHPRAYALYGPAKIAADVTLRPIGIVLGCIFVHEIGHLLGLSHQPHGAMHANLEPDDMDRIITGRAFNSFEAAKLRAAFRSEH
jgi:hypothetical protein